MALPQHPVEALVRQHLAKESELLDGSHCKLAPEWEWVDVCHAIARTAVAPEHQLGERPLAFFAMEKDYPESFNGYLLITDRRMVGRWPRLNGTFGQVHLRYAWVTAVKQEKGMLSNKLKVQHANQVIEMSFGPYCDQLKAFFDALLTVPPEQREPMPYGLPNATAEDPTGALGAKATLIHDDPRTVFLLDYLHQANAHGQMPPDIAGDLTTRLVIQHRNESCGRGVNDGSWMSPLGRDDLSNVLVALYQQPLHHVEDPHRSLTFDSRNKVDKLLDGLDKVAGAADLAADVFSLNAGGIAGAAIGAAFGPKTINNFTALMMDTGSFCSFRLFAGNQPLSQAEPWLAEDVCRTLERLEGAMVLRRCAYGWGESVQNLLNVPLGDIVQRFSGVVGEFDARVLAA